MSVIERPLTQSEIEILRVNSSASAKRSNYFAFAGISLMLLFVTFCIFALGWTFAAPVFGWPGFEAVKWKMFIISAVLSFAISGKTAIKDHKYIENRDELPKLADEDIRNGIAMVEQLDIEEAVEIEEWDDEGTGFLLSVKDGRVLCLIGQNLYPYSIDADPELSSEGEAGIFPSDKIAFVYAPRSGIVLSVAGTGQHLKPKLIVKWPGQGPSAKPYSGPIPDSFNNGPLDALIARTGFIEEPL